MRIMPGFALVVFFAGVVSAQPIASRISLGAPDANYQTLVTGAAGAVEANADVALVTIETGHYNTARAAADGSFSAAIFAPRGASILVKSDPERRFVTQLANANPPLINSALSELVSLPGTIMRVAVPPSQSGVAFAGAGIEFSANDAPFAIEGTINKQQFAAGETVEVRGTYTLLSAALATATNPRFQAGLSVELVSDASGRPMTAWSLLDSAVMTPTGLPIERMPAFGPGFGPYVPLTVQGSKGSGEFVVSFKIPDDLRAGYYRPRLGLVTQGIPARPPDTSVKRTTFISQFRGYFVVPPVIRIGSPAPPRFPTLLLMNDFSEGHRGAIAVEDRGRYAPANHIVTASEATILPRVDPQIGTPKRYRLDPFLLTLGASDRGGKMSGPLIPLRFPSGSVTVTVRAPSGATRTLGPAAFKQWLVGGPATRDGATMEGGPHITDAFQLRTLDPSFEISFSEDGRHVITVEGSIDDVWDTAWRVGGTYEIDVARPMVIDSAVIPMTPFEVANDITPVVQLVPPLAADVEMRVRLGARTTTFSGTANRFGRFAPPTWLAFNEPGEYRIDITARSAGWAGTRTWGGVVAPRNTPIVAHGRRGIDEQPDSAKQQWYFRSQTGDPKGRDHVQFCFHSGDVMWLEEGDASLPIITLQDPEGSVASKITALFNAARPQINGSFNERASKGELPLFSANAIANALDVSIGPDHADAWGYSYAAVERPLVRVRETIAEDVAEAYWRFNDRYGAQSGNGPNGDLPNDFKFQFGGAVLRGPLFDPARYAIYASLFVLVPESDPNGGTRVFPPFDRNGGALFSLKGKAIDIFFHPTSIKPGTILTLGETASFAGYSAPTLPSKLAIDVTSPSGRVRAIKGMANKIGWFYEPEFDFAVDEPGVWKAKVRITFDGTRSSGAVEPPFPSGDVLGSREGEFYFYVVRADAAALSIAPMPQFVRPSEGPINISVVPPSGLTNTSLTYTTTMPGFILEEGSSAAMTYTYDAPRLARDFSNLDLSAGEGSAGADVVTISLMLTGIDATGNRKHYARLIALNGEELLAPEQPPVITPKRRRAAR